MYSLQLAFVCATAIIGLETAHLPSFIKPCSRKLPHSDLSQCILTQAKNAQPYFIKGIPELDVEPLDPLSLSDITANAGTFIIKSKNVLVKGLKDMDLREISWDLEKNTARMKIFGNISFTSDYETDGRILLIPINGSGKLTVNTYDTEILIKYKIKKVKGEDGVEHVKTYDLKPSQTFGNVKFQMTNIFGGAAIGDTINQIMNENWRDLIKDLGPPYTKAVASKVHQVIDKLYKNVPYDELLAE